MNAPSPKELLIQEAIVTAEENAFPDWDGYGAEAVTKESLAAAIRFIRSLPDDLLPDPRVGGVPDGTLCFEWSRKRGGSISLSVDPDGTRHFAAVIGNYQDEGCGPESEGLPAGLVAALERLDAKV